MKKIIIILLTLISVNSFAGDTTTTFRIINDLCKTYDDAGRQFHCEGGNLVSQSSICYIRMPFKNLEFKIDETYSTSTVTKLKFTSDSKNVYIDCGSTPYTETQVYFNITNRGIAERLIEEFKRLKREFLEVYRGDYGNTGTDYSRASVSTILARVNELTKKYDPYVRTFYFNEDNKILIAKSASCTVVIPMKEITGVYTDKSGSDYHVSFKCSSYNNKCLYVLCDSFNNPDKETVITVNTQSAADEIARLLGYLKSR
jgi:hypothetical protein